MSTFLNGLVIVGASSIVAATSLTFPVAQAATCQARNATSAGVTSTDLQAVIDSAVAGDVIRVAGTCSGGIVIDKDLTLSRKVAADRATLDGGGVETVLTVTGTRASPITVQLNRLRITDGAAVEGGGIFSKFAVLRLRSNVVGNRATRGAGIYSNGSLVLRGNTSVRNNEAYNGGGVFAEGTVVLNQKATIAGNVALGGPTKNRGAGGGIYARRVIINNYARVIGNISSYGGGVSAHLIALRDHASVVRNDAHRHGGGVLVYNLNVLGKLRMSGAAQVSRNVADLGGGIYAEFAGVLLGDRASVTHNEATKTGGGVFSEQTRIRKLIPVRVRDGSTIRKNLPNNIVILRDPDRGNP